MHQNHGLDDYVLVVPLAMKLLLCRCLPPFAAVPSPEPFSDSSNTRHTRTLRLCTPVVLLDFECRNFSLGANTYACLVVATAFAYSLGRSLHWNSLVDRITALGTACAGALSRRTAAY